MTVDDPTAGATLFQLPSYAAAARARFRRWRHAGSRRVRPAAKGRLRPTRLPDDPRGRREGQRGVGAGRGRDRDRVLPQPPRTARLAVLRRLSLLRARRTRYRRTLGRMGTQARRPSARSVVRRRRGNRVTDPTVPTSGARSLPPDEAARERIRNDLDATLFVEAGAGAARRVPGRPRIVNLVRSGVPITGIATDHLHREGGRRTAQPHPATPRGPPRSRHRRSAGPPRPCADRHAALLRPPHPLRLPDRRRPPAGFHRARRTRERPRIRGAVERPARRTPRRRRAVCGPDRRWAGVRRAVRVRRIRRRQGVPPHGRRLPFQLGSRARSGRSVRPRPARPRSVCHRAARRPDRRHADPRRRQADRDRRRTRGAHGRAAQPEPSHPARSPAGARRQVRALGHRTNEPSRRQGQVDQGLRPERGRLARIAPCRRGRTRAARSRRAGGRQAAPSPTARCHHRSVRARRGDRTGSVGPTRVPRPAGPGPRMLRHPDHGTEVRASSAPATAACCSTSSRTPIRSRSSWRCSSPPTTRRRGPGPRVERRPRRPAGSSSSATPSSRSIASGAPTSRCSSRPARCSALSPIA